MTGWDPDIRQLPVRTADQPAQVLEQYRARLSKLPWADQTPSTLFAPVYTPWASADRFAEGIRQLYRAHLRLLGALGDDRSLSPAGRGYAEIAEPVERFYLDWPVLANEPWRGAADDPDLLGYLFGRPDVVLTAAGPKVVETNFDTAAAGQERPDDIWEIACEIFGPDQEYQRSGRPLRDMADYFAELGGGRPSDFHWIMPDNAETRREVPPLLDVLNRGPATARHLLHYAGDTGFAAEPDDRAGYLHRSCSIFSVNRDRDRFAAMLAELVRVAPGCTVPLGLSVLSSKLFLAWLSDPAARPADLTDAERAAIDTLLPWTRVLSLLDEPALARLLADKDDYIVKRADSHRGTEVHFGCNLDAEEWRAVLHGARAEPGPWIAQRRVRPAGYRLAEYTDDGLVVREVGLSCCPYLMGGQLRGLETWITPATPTLEMLDRMHFVPHFLRGGPA